MIPSALIPGVGTLLGFQLAGEMLVRLLHIPIPGPIGRVVLARLGNVVSRECERSSSAV